MAVVKELRMKRPGSLQHALDPAVIEPGALHDRLHKQSDTPGFDT